MDFDHLSLVSSSVLSQMQLYNTFYKDTRAGLLSSLSPLKFQQQLLYLNPAPIFITVKHSTSFWLIGAPAAGDRVPRQQNSLPVQHLQAAHTCNVNMKFKHCKSESR